MKKNEANNTTHIVESTSFQNADLWFMDCLEWTVFENKNTISIFICSYIVEVHCCNLHQCIVCKLTIFSNNFFFYLGQLIWCLLFVVTCNQSIKIRPAISFVVFKDLFECPFSSFRIDLVKCLFKSFINDVFYLLWLVA